MTQPKITGRTIRLNDGPLCGRVINGVRMPRVIVPWYKADYLRKVMQGLIATSIDDDGYPVVVELVDGKWVRYWSFTQIAYQDSGRAGSDGLPVYDFVPPSP